jgi:hypothetical protein
MLASVVTAAIAVNMLKIVVWYFVSVHVSSQEWIFPGVVICDAYKYMKSNINQG